MIAVDAGVIVARVTRHAFTEAALALEHEDDEWIAPLLWQAEVRNILAVKLHRIAGELTRDEAVEAYADALALLAGRTKAVDPVKALAVTLQWQISGYDAEYLTLAEVFGVELVTTDKRLVNHLAGKGDTGCRLLQ